MKWTGAGNQTSKTNRVSNWRNERSIWLLLTLGSVLLSVSSSALAANWKPLPDTGQTKCYDTSGNEMSCPVAGQPLHGQDAQYQGMAPSYSNETNTVTDKNTGLVWMKSDDDTTRSWDDAVDYCNGHAFEGQSNWRLPTKFELKSIIDYGRKYPAINPVFNCKSSCYWSATNDMGGSAAVWVVNFGGGDDGWSGKTGSCYARCVRAGR